MADENEPPPVSKLTLTKQRWAREGRFLSGMIFLSLIIYSTMRDTKHESAMHRHE